MKNKQSAYGICAVVITVLIILSAFVFDSSARIGEAQSANYSLSVIEEKEKMPYMYLVNKIEKDFLFQFFLFKKANVKNGKYIYTDANGTEVVFTVNPEVQKQIEREFKRYRLEYGAFVAIEPSTGKVVTAVSSVDYPDLTIKNTFVAASTFKIITAAAALENSINPNKNLVTRGHDDSCSPTVWFNSKYIIYRNMFHSFAYSSNPYFGVVGKLLGEKKLLDFASIFGFNRNDYNFPWGTVRKPLDDFDLALTAAGLGETRVSPFHEALISATIENGGVMILPFLVEEVRYKGNTVYEHKSPVVLRKTINKKTADTIKRMMLGTVRFGTASGKKFFKKIRRRSSLKMGGKTGTLSQLNFPEGRCEWFTGFVEDGDKKIAIASVAVNDARYYITGYDLSALAVLTMLKSDYLFAKR